MIRKALDKDLNEVEEIYHQVLDYEAGSVGYTNWQKDLYPTKADAKKALMEGTLFVGEDETGRLYGSIILNHLQPKEYGNIPWKIVVEDDEVLVIHTLCIRPNCSGKGYGREFVAFAQAYAQKLKCKTIRLDTYEGNLPAIRLYSHLGYQLAGKCLFHFQHLIWETLVCMEKKVEN
ncbi:TDP-fucosamine acetyltransferase [Anaerotignum neopropionicum]|uniref:TDP-fucosamine acetyltransferase n=1 Tax=Anaerotignum neopropionicum TaxID=36847 RepID=A0A136WB43_9FIRM|nr:GNAT family N-acetyltransferase [Anaerotignum neopropionicum]KXL51742.1 TDP-fucosamine acetyltransferase [Anaerotignum neopropionicum]